MALLSFSPNLPLELFLWPAAKIDMMARTRALKDRSKKAETESNRVSYVRFSSGKRSVKIMPTRKMSRGLHKKFVLLNACANHPIRALAAWYFHLQW
jgi:hypothetical protein